jgi:hypothetical protein
MNQKIELCVAVVIIAVIVVVMFFPSGVLKVGDYIAFLWHE